LNINQPFLNIKHSGGLFKDVFVGNLIFNLMPF
jgi:hypothetical protein